MAGQTRGTLHYNLSGSGDPLVILHGLFGSSKNWQSLAKQFAAFYSVYTVDLRNHGASFHDAEMGYSVMAVDVSHLLQQVEIRSCYLLGHSMGGKVAMTLANNNPALVRRLIVADIAPVEYPHDHNRLVKAIMAISLDDLGSRSTADQALASSIADPMMRGFLLQNLVRENESWHWKVNWSAIYQYMPELTAFQMADTDWSIKAPTLFIRGENSNYIDTTGISIIESHFTDVRVETITGAGHWLHAEQPRLFLDSVSRFLS